MSGPDRAEAFLGRWRIARRIEDARAGTVISAQGEANLVRGDGPVWTWDERVTLDLPGGPLAGERRYLWRARTGGVDIAFADGRPFHGIELGRPQAEARHHCPPDLYDVRYDLGGWPVWHSTWQVTGPRKSYLIRTTFSAPAK